jgi:hypothetical protein
MVRVVEPDADHLADAGERAAESGMAADRGQPRHVELLQALERGRREHLRRDVVDHRGQRAELAVGADDTGFSAPSRPYRTSLMRASLLSGAGACRRADAPAKYSSAMW